LDHRVVPRPKKPITRERRVTVRFTASVYEQIERVSAEDHRSVAGWIAAIVEKRLEAERKPKPK